LLIVAAGSLWRRGWLKSASVTALLILGAVGWNHRIQHSLGGVGEVWKDCGNVEFSDAISKYPRNRTRPDTEEGRFVV